MSTFQTVLLVVFGVFVVIGVVIFSTGAGTSSKGTAATGTGTVVIWGTIDSNTFNIFLGDFYKVNTTFTVDYQQKNKDTFNTDLSEALALGTGPDLIVTSQDNILKNKNKIFPIPYTSFTEAAFKTTYAQEAELFLDSSGILALPVSIDPMIMYYNRNMFDKEGIAKPPVDWDELVSLVPLFTKKDSSGGVTGSTVALGTYDNVNNAKDLISLLLLQNGNNIVAKDENGVYQSLLQGSLGQKVSTQNILTFYTNFSDPVNDWYSWNRGLPNSLDAFTNEDLAIYFGYASELFQISAKNSNLNFDLAQIPQVKGSSIKSTFGKMQSVAVLKSSKNLNTAFVAAFSLTGPALSGVLTTALNLPPVRRDLLAVKPTTPYYAPLFYNSVLIARSWLEPDQKETSLIFKDMIDDTTRGLGIDRAITRADSRLKVLLSNIK